MYSLEYFKSNFKITDALLLLNAIPSSHFRVNLLHVQQAQKISSDQKLIVTTQKMAVHYVPRYFYSGSLNSGLEVAHTT